jgi:hypothetical protein
MRTLRAWLVTTAITLCVSGPAHAQLVPGPACYVGFIGDLRQVIGNAGDANDFFRLIHGFSPTALRGTSDVLHYVGADRFHQMFDDLEELRSLGRNPFRFDEELFEVVAKLSERNLPGLAQSVGSLSGGLNNTQGATFSLFVAKRIANNGNDYGRVASFEHAVAYAGDRVRRFDILESSGIRHENKSWTRGLPDDSSSDFQHFMEEFRADIVIDRGFTTLRYNFHSSVSGGLAHLRAKFIEQFDDPFVVANLGGAQQAGLARLAFEDAWDANRIYTLNAF